MPGIIRVGADYASKSPREEIAEQYSLPPLHGGQRSTPPNPRAVAARDYLPIRRAYLLDSLTAPSGVLDLLEPSEDFESAALPFRAFFAASAPFLYDWLR